MKRMNGLGLIAVALGVTAQTASASLILETFKQFSGTGLGTVATLITFQATGTETGCFGSNGAGSALNGGVCTSGGDTKTGSSQAQLQPLSAATIGTGAAGAAQFGLIFNGVQPNGGPLLVNNITAAFYSSTGVFLYQSAGLLCQATSGGAVTSGPCLLPSTASGVGNSGYLVTLDAAQQAAAVAAGAFSSTGNLVGVSSSAGGTGGTSSGGPETIYLANTGLVGPNDTAVPEPQSLFLIGSGLLGLGFTRRRSFFR